VYPRSRSQVHSSVLVGLPEAAVRESVHRIERALVNRGYTRHPGRTVINLALAMAPQTE
jgi:magnesium chelatase family protein